MSVKLSNICIGIRDSKTSPYAADLLSILKARFSAKLTVVTTDVSNVSFGNGVEVVSVSSEKEAIHAIQATNADLVVVSISHLASGVQGLIGPKEASSLIDKLESAVLTIPANVSSLSLSQIVVPLDTSSETRQKVPYAVDFAKAFNSTIHVLGVSSETGKDAEVLIKNYMRQVSNNIEEKGVRVSTDMRLGGNPTDVILAFSKEKSVGLITIMTEQETSLVSFFKGKYSEQMIKNSDVPVLSIHPKDLIVSEARL